MFPAKLFVADHNADDRCRLRDYLEQEGFLVCDSADGLTLLSHLGRELPQLIILDMELPPIRGLELCSRIKSHGDIPIIALTALDDDEIKLSALDLYVEDYILKPAWYAEVVARIRRTLRRTLLSCLLPSPLVVDECLSLDFLRREARTPQGTSRLTPLECRFLQFLVQNAGQVVPSNILLDLFWNSTPSAAASLWEHVRRVRRKIGDNAAKPRYIISDPGLGYYFSPAKGIYDVQHHSSRT